MHCYCNALWFQPSNNWFHQIEWIHENCLGFVTLRWLAAKNSRRKTKLSAHRHVCPIIAIVASSDETAQLPSAVLHSMAWTEFLTTCSTTKSGKNRRLAVCCSEIVRLCQTVLHCVAKCPLQNAATIIFYYKMTGQGLCASEGHTPGMP